MFEIKNGTVLLRVLFMKPTVIRIWINLIEGLLKIDTLCFELSHSIESSLRSLSTI